MPNVDRSSNMPILKELVVCGGQVAIPSLLVGSHCGQQLNRAARHLHGNVPILKELVVCGGQVAIPSLLVGSHSGQQLNRAARHLH